MAEDLIAEIQDGVGTILFNRPQRLNAVSPEMVEAFIRRSASLRTGSCGALRPDPRRR